MPGRMAERMPDRMSESLPEKMSYRKSEIYIYMPYIPEGMSETMNTVVCKDGDHSRKVICFGIPWYSSKYGCHLIDPISPKMKAPTFQGVVMGL